MQCRYLYDSRQAFPHARLARQVMPALAQKVTLQIEALYPESEAESLYRIMSEPVLHPSVQIFHGDVSDFKAHPLQWNIIFEPNTQEIPTGVDEIWSQDEAVLARYASEQCVKTPLPEGLLAEPLQSSAQAPIEIEEENTLFVSLDWSQQAELSQVLQLYMEGLYAKPQYGLAIHLCAEPELEHIEEALLEKILALTEASNLDPEQLNLGTWIGPLEKDAYLSMLQASCALVFPRDFQAAREARALGLPVIALDQDPQSLEQTLQQQTKALSDIRNLIEAMHQRLEQIDQEFDPQPRALAFQKAEAERQGRKQKYSLFHSDYNSQEMQARRKWHENYARLFKDVPGPVLDIGCGSGIFLEIMRDWGWAAFGLDPDEDMVDVCKELKLQAIAGDEQKLSEFQPLSLGGIHASHVIEHVDGDRAIALIENARRILRPGGALVIRTPNWKNTTVRHEGFWLDVTHIRPYPLPLLKQICEDAGLRVEIEGYEDFGWNDTYILARQPEVSHV